MGIRHPEVVARLTGEDGNSYSILARVRQALRRAGVPREEVEEYVRDATSGDRDHLLVVTMQWVTVD